MSLSIFLILYTGILGMFHNYANISIRFIQLDQKSSPFCPQE